MKISAPVPTTTARLETLLARITPDFALHARLLNTMSYMEHIGATKIARTQSGPDADFMALKHTAEEARHAFYLKKLSRKLLPDANPSYAFEYLLAPVASRQYLYRLDIGVSRLIRHSGLEDKALRDLAYLLVTYAIEVRADEIYPIYQSFLQDYPVKLSVQGIINEEEGHLEEMETALSKYPEELQALKEKACELEGELYLNWLAALEGEILEN
ncbi:MAG: hypothetical protein AAF570_20600 [Bacteroidota bacterium]